MQAGGYVLEPPDVKAKSSVKLNTIQKMISGTKIRSAGDPLPFPPAGPPPPGTATSISTVPSRWPENRRFIQIA